MNDSNRTPTINDVAREAGVSKRTVSRVINGSDKVNEATRTRVQKIIKKLNFAPNRQARGLAASKSYLLGLVFDMPTLFINDIQMGMLNICEEAGYELVVHASRYDSESMADDVMNFMRRAHVDGVIILPPNSDVGELAKRLEDKGTHFVRFTSRLEGNPQNVVVTDYLPAISDMTRYLVERGHREFGFITGPPDQVSSQMRQETFAGALTTHGLELKPEMIVEGAFTYESGLSAAKTLLTRARKPTAIFAANDEMAFGVMKVAGELGLQVPADLSVVGFDGTPYSSFVTPSLSTIIRQTDRMVHLGARKLLAMINGENEAAEAFDTMVSPRFLPRESTGPAPKIA